jgi:hypothetical protein
MRRWKPKHSNTTTGSNEMGEQTLSSFDIIFSASDAKGAMLDGITDAVCSNA